MNDDDAPPLLVSKDTIVGFVPVAWFFYCGSCEEDLSAWVMKQTADRPAACPRCGTMVAAVDVAQAQRQTKVGCLLSLAGFAALFLIPAAIVGVILLFLPHGR